MYKEILIGNFMITQCNNAEIAKGEKILFRQLLSYQVELCGILFPEAMKCFNLAGFWYIQVPFHRLYCVKSMVTESRKHFVSCIRCAHNIFQNTT